MLFGLIICGVVSALVAPFGQIHKDDILGFVLGGGPQHELGFCIEPLQIICAECRC